MQLVACQPGHAYTAVQIQNLDLQQQQQNLNVSCHTSSGGLQSYTPPAKRSRSRSRLFSGGQLVVPYFVALYSAQSDKTAKTLANNRQQYD